MIPTISSIDKNFLDSNTIPLTDDQIVEFIKTIDEFPSFAKSGLGKTHLEEHYIDTGDAVPIKSKYYPLSPPREAEVYAEIERLRSLGIVVESNSSWSSPIVVVRKPDSTIRLCIDFRKLNSVTKKDAYPLQHIGGLLSRVKNTHFISKIDLQQAFHQIPLEKTSREKTAFAVPGMPLLEFTVMPFGLCNASQRLVRLLDKVIPTKFRDNIFIYLDDLLVCTETFDEHISILLELAKCLKHANLSINMDKSKFCQKEIQYLGYIIGQGCLKTDPSKLEAITDFPLPKTARQVRRFIGMTGWYRQFIPSFATLSAPLTDCLRKGKEFALTKEAEDAFQKLKEALTTAPVLAQPDFTKPFVIQCDASSLGVGGVLFQLDNEGHEHPIAYVYQKLNKAQRNYTVSEQECMAAIVCVNKFRPYIEGLPFKIITDHSSLKWLMSQKDLSGRLARWSLKLQSFDFVMEHRKGALNVVPDALSRLDMCELRTTLRRSEIDLKSEFFNSQEYLKLKADIDKNQACLPDISISDGYVYKRVKFRTGSLDEEESLWRLWLPKELTEVAVANEHCEESGCHGGLEKTLFRVRQKYYWPEMVKQFKTFIAACDICKAVKPANSTLRPKMVIH